MTCQHDALHASGMILHELCDVIHGVAVRHPYAVAACLVLSNLFKRD